MRRGPGQGRVGRGIREGPGAGDGRTAVELCRAQGGTRAGNPGHPNLRVACLAPGREFTSFTPKYELFTFFASPGQCFSKYAGH